MKRLNRLFIVAIFLFPKMGFAFHEAGEYEHAYEVDQVKSEIERELREYEKDIQSAIKKYEEKTAHIWGDATVTPDPRQDVTYRNNQTERSIINYEEGKVIVEIAINLDKSMNKKRIARQLSDAIADILVNGPDTRSIIEIAENPDVDRKATKGQSLLSQVATQSGKPLTDNEVKGFTQKQLNRVRRHQLTGNDGVTRYVFTTDFTLVPEHIKVRAEKYRNSVELHANKFHIPTPLIYAIMETESFFNPFAKSPVPAFGLLQLVPTTGARDAFKFLFNEDTVVKEDYLYSPEKNIELGVAYMHVIYYKYLHKIQDPKTRLWVMIAAYNTGVINVLKGINGEYDKQKYGSMYNWKNLAIDKINKMTPEQVFQLLQKNLPAEETRDYLNKVRQNMVKYST